MWVAVRENDNVSGLERNWPAVALDMRISAPFSQQVKDDDVAASIGKIGGEHARSGRAEAPGRGKLRVVEHRAVESDGLEHFGQDIHWNVPMRRRSANKPGRSIKGRGAGHACVKRTRLPAKPFRTEWPYSHPACCAPDIHNGTFTKEGDHDDQCNYHGRGAVEGASQNDLDGRRLRYFLTVFAGQRPGILYAAAPLTRWHTP